MERKQNSGSTARGSKQIPPFAYPSNGPKPMSATRVVFPASFAPGVLFGSCIRVPRLIRERRGAYPDQGGMQYRPLPCQSHHRSESPVGSGGGCPINGAQKQRSKRWTSRRLRNSIRAFREPVVCVWALERRKCAAGFIPGYRKAPLSCLHIQ